VAANDRAARHGKSHDDFTAKIGTVSEEADECVFWLKPLQTAHVSSTVDVEPLFREAEELAKIFGASARTTRSRRRKRRPGDPRRDDARRADETLTRCCSDASMSGCADAAVPQCADARCPNAIIDDQIAPRRSKMQTVAMIPVHRFMPEVLSEILRKAPLTPEKIAFAWRSAVGPAVDKVTEIELRGAVLHVRAKDAAWQREVERSASIIRARLDALLGPGVVRYVDITAGSERSRAESGSGSERPDR
jgi:hypothetical protein